MARVGERLAVVGLAAVSRCTAPPLMRTCTAHAVTAPPRSSCAPSCAYVCAVLCAGFIDYLKKSRAGTNAPRPRQPPMPRTHPEYSTWQDIRRIYYLRNVQHERIARCAVKRAAGADRGCCTKADWGPPPQRHPACLGGARLGLWDGPAALAAKGRPASTPHPPLCCCQRMVQQH